MNKNLILLFTILVTSFGFSQNNEKAERILEKVTEELEQYQNISIEFIHTLENKMVNIKQSSKGSAIIEGDKYILHYLDNIILFDENFNYAISPENEEINITAKNEISQESLTPSKLLNFYKKGYNYLLDKKEEHLQYIKLTPSKISEEVSYVLLAIDTQKNQINSLTEIGKNGTNTNFTITDYKTNQTLDPNTFYFDKKKYEALGYYINE